jgi:hypothetical protein
MSGLITASPTRRITQLATLGIKKLQVLRVVGERIALLARYTYTLIVAEQPNQATIAAEVLVLLDIDHGVLQRRVVNPAVEVIHRRVLYTVLLLFVRLLGRDHFEICNVIRLQIQQVHVVDRVL